MPTVTLQIMLSVPTHTLPMKKHRMRPVVGDIHNFFLTSNHAAMAGSDWQWNEPIRSPRMAMIHIEGMPANAVAQLSRLMEPITRVEGEGEDARTIVIRTSQWRVNIPGLLTAERNALLADKEITITYIKAKPLIERKVIVTVDDPDADAKAILTDADLL